MLPPLSLQTRGARALFAVDVAAVADVAAAGDAFGDEVLAAISHADPRIALLQAGASLFASVFGFGDAVIAVPLLAVLFHVETLRAAPLVSFVTFFLTCTNAAVDTAQGVQQKTGRWLTTAAMVGGAAVGVPLGVDALQSLEPYAIRGFVGAFLVGYGAWDLWRDKETSGEAGVDEASAGALAEAVPYGVAAGFLGGAIAEPGPVAVVLSNKRRWSPPTTRAMLVRFFIPVQILALTKFRAAGLLPPETVAQGLAALPGVFLAAVVGTAINRVVDEAAFADVVAGIVASLGVLCLATAYGDFAEVTAAASSSIILS